MKDKNLPPDNKNSLEDLTKQANQIVEFLENEKDLNNTEESYQKLLRLNNEIKKSFQQNLKKISKETDEKVKKIKEKK